MAKKTTNYNLTKPDYNEVADIGIINANMDIIDTKMKELEDAGGGSTITVDAELSTVSENPVQNKVVTAELNGLKSEIVDLTGAYSIENFKSDKAILLNEPIANITTPVFAEGVSYSVTECKEGDIFTITATGFSGYRTYGFVAGSDYSTPYAILEVAENGLVADKKVVIAPANAKYLVINDTTNSLSYKGEMIIKKVNEVEAEISNNKAYNEKCYAKALYRNAGVTYDGYFIDSLGVIGPISGDKAKVTAYKVTKGDVITLYGKDVKLNIFAGLAAFSTEPISEYLQCELILTGNTTAMDYNKPYFVQDDGYIYIYWRNEENIGRLNLYNANLIKDAMISLDCGPIKKTDVTYTEIEYGFIYNDHKIQIATGTYARNHEIRQYDVVANHLYHITGNGASSGSNYRPLAGFSTESYSNNPNLVLSNVIIAEYESAIPADYDILFIPEQNGYVYIYENINYPSCNLVEAEIDSRRLLKLTQSSNDTLKIQCFGDSITDNTWGDHITWTTFFSEYIPQRKINLINSGNGGSQIGHGKSVGGQYTNLEYNYVYDLITNPDVFVDDCDIYIILIGANDYNSGELGEWGDATIDTFYGALRIVCEYMSEHVKGRLLFITPIQRYNSSDKERPTNTDGEPINEFGATVRDYADAIVRTCHFYSIPVLDLNYESGINRINIDDYTADGLHTNKKGDRVIARLIASEIKKHLGI